MPGDMASSRPSPAYDRVVERRRAVALAWHFREAEGLSIARIPDRLRRSPATVKACYYDPTGEKAGAVKARYVGVCRGCGAYTQPRNGKRDAYAYCKALHPGAIRMRSTRESVLAAMRQEYRQLAGWPPIPQRQSESDGGSRRRGRPCRSSDGAARLASAPASANAREVGAPVLYLRLQALAGAARLRQCVRFPGAVAALQDATYGDRLVSECDRLHSVGEVRFLQEWLIWFWTVASLTNSPPLSRPPC